MPNPPRPDTQEGRILAILEDGRTHTLHDWPLKYRYTGRNAISRLRRRGYDIRSWFSKTHGVQAYRLSLVQRELQLTDERG